MNRFRSTLRVLTVLVAAYVGAPAAASGARPELRPALPAQTWREHQHVMGFLSVTDTGQLRFSTVLSENSPEPEHPGYWIESWKVDEIRRVLPSALRQFRFGETITVGGVKYLRVLPESSPPNGLARSLNHWLWN